MSTKKDTIQLDIIVGANKARQEMMELEGDIKKLNKELNKLPEGSTEAANAIEQIAAKRARLQELRNEIGLDGMTMKELKNRARELQLQLNNLDPRTDKWKASRAEMNQVQTRMGQLSGRAVQHSFSFGKLADGFNKYMGIVAAGAAIFTGIAMSLSSTIQGNAKLSDSYADIQKTTGMTTEEVKNLDKSFKGLDTRTKAADLRQIAVVAGQLGIAKEDVFGFSASVDKLAVSLGDEFQGGAEEVATKMGTLRNVFGDMQTKDVGNDMLKIGNAINVLGAAGFATGPVMVDLSNRIGGVGINLGLTSGQVLGMSATMQELNISAERGGTAVSQILMKMTTNTKTFAKVAGMDVTSFKNLLNKDLYGAFMKVVEGSQKMGGKATDLAAIMDSLKIDGAGASEVFSKLGKNTDLLKQRIDLATVSLTKTDSVMSEFNTKNNTLAAKLEKIGKAFTSAFVNPQVTQWLEGTVNLVYKWMGLRVSDKLEKERFEVNGLAIQLMNHNIPASERNRLYDELKQKAPSVLANINKESINYKQLTANLKAYNDEMINKIVLQKKDEDIQEITSKAADQRSKKMDAETNLAGELRKSQEYVAGVNKQYGQYLDVIINSTSLSLEQKGEKFRKFLMDEKLYNALAFGDKTRFNHITGAMAKMYTASQSENDFTTQLNKITIERQQIADKLKTTLSTENTNFEKIGDDIGSKTIAQLKSKVENYNRALETAAIGSEAYIRIQKKIAEANKLIEAGNQNTPDAPAEPDSKEAKKAQKLLEEAYTKEKNAAEAKAKTLLTKEKAYYTDSIKGASDYSTQKKEITDKYSIEDINNKEAYELRLIDVEVSGLEASKVVAEKYRTKDKENAEKYDKEISDLNEKIEAKKQEREEKLFTIADERRKQNLKKEENDLNTKHAKLELSDEEYNKAMLLAKAKYIDAEIEAYSKANKSTYDLEQQKVDNSIALINLEINNKKKLRTSELNIEEANLKAREKYASRSLFLLNKQYRDEAALLKKRRKDGLDKEEEYQQKMGDLAGRTFDAKMSLVNNYAEQAGGIMGSFLTGQSKNAKQYLKTMIDMALDALEAQLLVQQVSVTAQSVAQPDSIATFGATGLSRALIINGFIHAAFAAAKAGINSAFYTGGYTGDGHPLEPAGTVHKGEYVIPTFVMSEPSVVRQVQVLENIRREKLGYAIGGSVTGSSSTNSTALPQFTGQNDTLQALNSTIAALNTIIASGIDAKIDYAHHTNQLNKMDKVKNIAKHS